MDPLSCPLRVAAGDARDLRRDALLARDPRALSQFRQRLARHGFCDGQPRMSPRIEKFNYDDGTVRKFVFATAFWGVVATLVGLWLALMLVLAVSGRQLANMSIIFLILPVTLLLSAGAVAAFAWATRSGQFDDLETPAIRLLHDEDAKQVAGPADSGPQPR
jgi:cbb3-type cytochrome oxidase maturation protein